MSSTREHVERIRRERYYIGRDEQNPLSEDLHQAVSYLSKEIYSKDVHFLMELVQNAEDNEYPDGVAGNRDKGYIGEKGIGFKSVFLISSQPHIFSNGYQVKFDEKPCRECNVGYIVPTWVESRPNLSDIKQIYGCSKNLPATCIVLPLKDEKVTTVKQQLSSLHPEMLLFLSKIRRLSVREDNCNPEGSTASEIAISSVKNYEARKSMHAESYTLHLSAQENENEEECGYYMWRQKFPVKPENRVDKRTEIDEWAIVLAFPRDAPAMSLPSMFHFLPTDSSLIPLLEPIRSGIKEKVLVEDIVPCESHTPQKIFCKPREVARLKPIFWDILVKARESGVDLNNLSTHGTYILSSHFDKSAHDSVLTFLDVKSVTPEWYAKCIEGSNLVNEVHEELYLELLSFVVDNWQSFSSTNMVSIPLLKYVNRNNALSLWSISRASQWNDRLCIASDKKWISWLVSWNQEFPSSNRLFMPPSTQTALGGFWQKEKVTDWLQNHASVEIVSVYSYGKIVVSSLNCDRRPVIAFSHFLYHSSNKDYMESYYLAELCRIMPVIDNYGNVETERESILVPAKGSKWVGLMSTNPWRNEKYIELSADYKSAGCFAGNSTSEDQILDFLKTNIRASDVPFVHPPNASFPTVSSPLTVDNAILLLQWIRNLKSTSVQLPASFLACVKEGSWLKTSVGYKPPSESFISCSEWGNLLPNGSSFVDIPMIDQQFYENQMQAYKEELKLIGVRFEFGEASVYIGSRLMSMAASNTLTRENVYQLLQLIRFLQEKVLSPSELINSVKDGQWMKTTLGYKSPTSCIIYKSDWAVASCISNQPFLDVEFYGKDILTYKGELKLLGVLVGFENDEKNYRLIIDNFKFSSSAITPDATALILKCIRYASPCDGFLRELKGLKWLKTNVGFRAPSESFLLDPEWECLLMVFNGIPVVDSGFYGSKLSPYKEELNKTGLITRSDKASKAIESIFKQMVSESLLTKASILALLTCYRQLRAHDPIHVELFNYMRSENWLCTSLGFRSPSESILLDEDWQSLSPIANLPFINDGDSHDGLSKEIHGYRDELKELGVTTQVRYHGARFVINGLNIPKDPADMSSTSVLSLLGCVRSWLACTAIFPKDFMEKITSCRWLRTTLGYQSPEECILFDPEQSNSIDIEDGPFIDECFYGSEIASFRDALAAIGVTVDVRRGHDLVAQHLRSHKETATISRVYMYLKECKWEPVNKKSDWIWKPNEREWVSPLSCVLHDPSNLFGPQLHVLDRHYDKKLRAFFSSAFGVRHGPDAQDHCKLWSTWESSGCELSVADCSAFWQLIAENWSRNTETKLPISGCAKVPTCTDGKIILLRKEDAFIPDDLLVEDLFNKLHRQSVFVWYPPPSFPVSRARLNSIYGSIGVRAISKAVERDDDDSSFTLGDGSSTTVDRRKRHTTVSRLVNVSVLETEKPIMLGYRVKLSCGEAVDVKSSRRIRWERGSSKLYMQRSDGAAGCCYKEKIEFATNLADEISQGLLFEMPDQIPSLAQLIKLGSLVEFQEAAIEYLLKSKNLQVFPEDEAFLLNAAMSLGGSEKC
ncbi:unnamed protein product [Alopecurus aequalis]